MKDPDGGGNGNGHGNGRPRGGRRVRRDISKDEALMERVVVASYSTEAGEPAWESARKVGRQLGLTVPAVIALLARAFERSMFSIDLHLPHERIEVARLEQAVKKRYGLKDVRLVPGIPQTADELDQARRRALHTRVTRQMARRVGERLDELVEVAAPDVPFIVGVAWGRTMRLVADRIASSRRPRLPSMRVYPIVGVTFADQAEPVEGHSIAETIAEAYGGCHGQLPCAAFVPAAEETLRTRQDHAVRSILARLRKANVVITGMGPIPHNVSAAEITLTNDPVLNEQLLQMARNAGARAEICYWLMNAHGQEVRTDYKGVGLGLDGLREIARDRSREVILVVGGDRWRFEPLRIALNAGLASVLVSCTVTARYLMGELSAHAPAAAAR